MRFDEDISDPDNVCPLAELLNGEHVCTVRPHSRPMIVDDCANHKWKQQCFLGTQKMKELGIWRPEWG